MYKLPKIKFPKLPLMSYTERVQRVAISVLRADGFTYPEIDTAFSFPKGKSRRWNTQTGKFPGLAKRAANIKRILMDNAEFQKAALDGNKEVWRALQRLDRVIVEAELEDD